MEKIDLKEIISSKAPNFFNKYPEFLTRGLLKIGNKALHVKEVNEFIANSGHLKGFDFIDKLFEYLDFSYSVSSKDRMKIPSEGKLVIVSNHPMGSLDGLALLKAVSEVRPDVKIVANDVLSLIEPLDNLFLPYDVFSLKNQKKYLKNIDQALANDEAVIFFPAGEVSRFTPKGICDGKWRRGALSFARKHNAPVLPAFVKARNSALFYFTSMIYRNAATFLLPHELFNKKNKTISIKFGDPINPESFKKNILHPKVQIKLLKKHVYRLKKNKSAIYGTEKTIIHPVPRKILKSELLQNDLIGKTSDGMQIFLVDYENGKNVMMEIARLREITFRKVGEGTGKSFDFDEYDVYYRHIVLWDDDELEIAGAYRLGMCKEIINDLGVKGLYNASQFKFSDDFRPILNKSIEMGRSFIQQKYWRSYALDYIWQGIGSFLQKNPEIRYLWGAVSISDNYPDSAKNMIIYYYNKWYGGDANLANAIYPYRISKKDNQELEKLFNSDNPTGDFRILKNNLRVQGFTIPVLYRRYSELTEYGGSKFYDFAVDKKFSDSIDGLILVDMDMVKADKKERYYLQKSFVNN